MAGLLVDKKRAHTGRAKGEGVEWRSLYCCAWSYLRCDIFYRWIYQLHAHPEQIRTGVYKQVNGRLNEEKRFND